MSNPVVERWNSKRFGGVGCPKIALRKRRIQAMVIHATDGSEGRNVAANVCHWWDQPAAGGNAHRVYDASSIYRYVADERAAWHASQANHWSLGYEFCGKAGQTAAQWLDDVSLATLRIGAEDMARDAVTYGVDIRWLTDEELLAIHAGDESITGVTDHATIDKVWPKRSGGHWDPGPGWPMLDFMIALRGYVELGR